MVPSRKCFTNLFWSAMSLAEIARSPFCLLGSLLIWEAESSMLSESFGSIQCVSLPLLAFSTCTPMRGPSYTYLDPSK